jgi:hypothetical protein
METPTKSNPWSVSGSSNTPERAIQNDLQRAMEASMKEKYRQAFLERAFGIVILDGMEITSPKTAKTSKMLTEKEWNERCDILQHWEFGVAETEISKAALSFRRSHHMGYHYSSKFYCVSNTSGVRTLMAYRPTTSNKAWHRADRAVAHTGIVFDIIYRAHNDGHIKASHLHNKLKYRWSNVSEELCKLLVKLCPACLVDQAKVVPSRGASKPIPSFRFRDRIQADLVDFRMAPARLYPSDINSPIMLWLLVVKDHFTKMVYLRPLMAKAAEHVAVELDYHFSYAGYPIIFQSDNGTEFKAEVLRVLKRINPFMYTVNGRPRRPQEQGSVENVNKCVKRILARTIYDKRQKLEEDDDKGRRRITWVSECPTAMRAINGTHSSGVGQVTPYEMVYSMPMDEPMFSDVINDKGQISDVATVAERVSFLSDQFQEKMVALGEFGDGVDQLEQMLGADIFDAMAYDPLSQGPQFEKTILGLGDGSKAEASPPKPPSDFNEKTTGDNSHASIGTLASQPN